MPKLSSLFLYVLLALSSLLLSSCSQKAFDIHYPQQPSQDSLNKITVNPQMLGSRQEGKFIIIDAGHGGKDSGAEGTAKPIVKEKILTLMTARMVEKFLQQMGYRTLMTRREDLFVSLDKRATIANNLHPDLFVSIHYNSAANTKAEGIEVFYYRTDGNKERSQASKELAESILKYTIIETKAKSRGVKHGNLAVVRKTLMPAVLVEGGFITNEKELAKLKDPIYLKALAWGIAQGIQAFLTGR